MKKIKLNGKLSLNKETIARLNDDEMSNIQGGGFSIWGCPSNHKSRRAKNCCNGGGKGPVNGSPWYPAA
jgi:natural product precursor